METKQRPAGQGENLNTMLYRTNAAYFAYAHKIEGGKFGDNCPPLNLPSYNRFEKTTTPYFTAVHDKSLCGSFPDYGFVGVGEKWKTSWAGNDTDVYYHPQLNLLVYAYAVSDIRVGKGGFKSETDRTLFYEYQLRGAQIVAVSTDFFSTAIVTILSA